MNLLLVILFAAGATLGEVMNWPPNAPVPSKPAPTFAIVPPSRTIALEWNNSPTPGTSNVVCYGESKAALTNRLEVGTTNLCFINVDSTRRFYAVKAVVGGIESEPSNVVKYPGDVIRESYVAKPDRSTVHRP